MAHQKQMLRLLHSGQYQTIGYNRHFPAVRSLFFMKEFRLEGQPRIAGNCKDTLRPRPQTDVTLHDLVTTLG